MKYPRVVFYMGLNDKWRWRMLAKNGRIICTPGESFSSKAKAEHNFDCVANAIWHGVEMYDQV